MKPKSVFIICLLLLLRVTLHGQINFVWDQHTLRLVEVVKLSAPIQHNLPVTEKDDARIQLFKKYFNPGSLSQFQSMYLPSDWIHLDQNAYHEWQERLTLHPLLADQYMILKDNVTGQTYLTIQYRMETPQYTLYESVEFKWVRDTWKHINYQEDLHGIMIARIGEMDAQYIESLTSHQHEKCDLAKVQQRHFRTFQEKFSREEIFNAWLDMLRARNISEADIDVCRQHFLNRSDNLLLETLTMKYQWPATEIVASINEVSGFSLFHFSSSVQHEE